MKDPRFHWDSFFLGSMVAMFLDIAFHDYMPDPMFEISTNGKLIAGIAGLGMCILYLIHMLHKPHVTPGRKD